MIRRLCNGTAPPTFSTPPPRPILPDRPSPFQQSLCTTFFIIPPISLRPPARHTPTDARLGRSHALAKNLISEYIVDGSDNQVNIPGGLQRAIIDAERAIVDSNRGPATKELFEKMKEAQSEIYLLMARDNYSRFVKTDAFKNLLNELGAYGEGVKDLVSEQDLTLLVQDGEGGNLQLRA